MLEKPQRPLTDHEERMKAITNLARLFRVAKFDGKMLDVILEAVAELSTASLQAACKIAARTADRMPTPAALIRYAQVVAPDGKPAPPTRVHRSDAPTTAEKWLEFHSLEVRDDWLSQPGMRSQLERAASEAATCGEREECQNGKCREQVPVPRTTSLYHGTNAPPTLYLAYVPCPEHETRCAWRKQHRKPQETAKGRAA